MLGDAFRIAGETKRREQELRKSVGLIPLFVMKRQNELGGALQRKQEGKDPWPDDERWIKEVQENPRFYGLKAPPQIPQRTS